MIGLDTDIITKTISVAYICFCSALLALWGPCL